MRIGSLDNMPQKNLKRYGRLVGWLIVGLVAFFFAATLRSNWDGVRDIDLKVDIYVLGALVCFVSAIVVSGLGWGHIASRLTGLNIKNRIAVRIHLASWLLKYIPGQAGSLLNKLAWAKNNNVDGKKITASFIYENMFLLLAAATLSIPILLISLGGKFIEGISLFIPIVLAVPLIILLLTPGIFAKVINILFKVIKKKPLKQEELLNLKDNVGFLVEFIIPRAVTGLAFTLIAVSIIGTMSLGQGLTFAAVYILAGAVGLVAIFVPSGLGVREAVIVLFASAYIPVEQAIALSIAARFYATIADILAALLYLFLRRTER